MATHNRRSFLTLLGTAAATSVAGTAVADTGEGNTDAKISSTSSNGQRELLGVELIDLESGERTRYKDHDEIDLDEQSAGRYEAIDVYREDGRIVERPHRFTVAQQTATTAATGTELRAMTASETVHGYHDPDGSVPIIVGAVERKDGEDIGPVEDVDLTVTIQGPDGTQLYSDTKTTDQRGMAQLEYQLDGASAGRYEVRAQSSSTDSTANTSFGVGPYIGVPFHWTGMTPGKETTIGYYSEVGGVPDSNVERTVEISGPNNTTETQSLSFQDGIGLLSYTPAESGRYSFRSEAGGDSAYLGCARLKAYVPYFEIRDQRVGKQVDFGGHLVQDREPVTDEDIVITVKNQENGTVVETIQATTNQFGQFQVQWSGAPEPVEYAVEIETERGDPVFLFGDTVTLEEPSSDTGSPVEVDVSTEDYQVGIGTDLQVTIEVTENGSPVTNKSVTVFPSYTYQNVPAGGTTVQTGANGTATYTHEIPSDAPDGERLNIMAFVTQNGTRYSGSSSADLERYSIEIQNEFDLTPGEVNSLPVRATERTSGESVSGIHVTAFGNRYNVKTETVDADSTQTDASGEGQLSLDIPADVTNDFMLNSFTPYESANTSGGDIQDAFDVSFINPPEEAVPGEMLTVSYDAETNQDVSAVVTLESETAVDIAIAGPSEQVMLSVPSYVGSDDGLTLTAVVIAQDGEVVQASEYIDTAPTQTPTATFTVSPSDPTVGEPITLDASGSASPNGSIVSYEWDLNGDGAYDTASREVRQTLSSAGELTITLRVTDESGATATTSQTLTVTDGSTPDGDWSDPYVNENGVVDDTGLNAAIGDYLGDSGSLGDSELNAIINSYLGGSPIQA